MQLAAARSDVSSPVPLRESCGRRVLGDDPWVVEAARSGGRYGIKAYTAREWDPEINLYYYRARYYDPKLGRFISEDPIRFAAGANFYAYVLNQPTRFTDPGGLQVHPPGWWQMAATYVCVQSAFAEGGRLGGAVGYRYGHCMAACLARKCGLPKTVVKGLGLGNELKQTKECLEDGNCHSAFGGPDFRDNEVGYSCPEERPCEDQCDVFVATGQTEKTEEQYGPFYWFFKEWFAPTFY